MTRADRIVCGAVAVAAAVSVFACRRASPAPAAAPRPNLVLITIDTLRADRTGRGLTPVLDRVAASGVRFVNARTAVPLTLPSHTTILTGQLPPRHGVRENGQVLASSTPTLSRALHDAGYATGAFVGAYVLDRRFGLATGFDVYDDRVHRDPVHATRLEAERRGGEVVDAALGWLGQVDTPFFLWVHLYDPHAPYDPPAEYLARAGGVPYDGEIAYADAQAGRVLDALRSRGILDRTVVAIAGDHGEGLGDHGERTHGMLAYDSTLRVPLVVAGPGLAPSTVSTPVSLSSLASRLLVTLGLPASLLPEADAPMLVTNRSGESDVYAETRYPRTAGWHPLTVLAGEQWKLVLSSEAELYDVSADPGETRNLAAAKPGVVEGMRARLQPIGAATASGAPPVSVETTERLRALGYVGSTSSAGAIDGAAPNPAATIEAWNEFERALSLLSGDHAREALPPLRALVSRFPDAPVFQSTLARAHLDLGRPADAVRQYRRLVARWSDDPALFHDLAVAARAAGNTSEAFKAEQAALALDANSPSARNGLGLLYADAGRAADAASAFERAANADPSNASYWTNLGNATRALGNLAGADAAYIRALAADPSFADAANGRGVILVQQKRAADAIPWFERALASAPDLHEARLNLGIAYDESGDHARAVAVYREILAHAPARFTREREAAAALLKSR